MTSDESVRPVPAGVVPRWEWRTFGGLEGDEALARLRTPVPHESRETYVVSLLGDASVKVRDGLLDVKVLRQVSRSGLQLWVPSVKAGFPVDGGTVAEMLAALGVPAPAEPLRPSYSLAALTELLDAREDVRRVDVRKTRHRSVLEGCMVELTELSADGKHVTTVAVESPDPALVSRTVAELGLAGRFNTCVARGLKSLLGWRADRFAVLDVGTNSVKFVVGDLPPDGTPQVRRESAVVTRLGQGLSASGELSAEAMDRTTEAITVLLEEARRDGPVDVVAVGTAGLRQARNSEVFLDEVLSRTGVTVEVISGAEEARLAYLAAVSTLPLTGDRLLVFDSGGGSSQFTFGTRDDIEEQFSLDVGAVRFTDEFGLAGAVSRATVDAALAAVAEALASIGGRPRPDTVVAIGGTSTNLAAVSAGLESYDPDVVHGAVVDLGEIDRQIELYRQRPADERRGIPGLQPARAEVILAGACIVRTIVTSTGQSAVVVSDRGLRHGVVAERVRR